MTKSFLVFIGLFVFSAQTQADVFYLADFKSEPIYNVVQTADGEKKELAKGIQNAVITLRSEKDYSWGRYRKIKNVSVTKTTNAADGRIDIDFQSELEKECLKEPLQTGGVILSGPDEVQVRKVLAEGRYEIHARGVYLGKVDVGLSGVIFSNAELQKAIAEQDAKFSLNYSFSDLTLGSTVNLTGNTRHDGKGVACTASITRNGRDVITVSFAFVQETRKHSEDSDIVIREKTGTANLRLFTNIQCVAPSQYNELPKDTTAANVTQQYRDKKMGAEVVLDDGNHVLFYLNNGTTTEVARQNMKKLNITVSKQNQSTRSCYLQLP